MISVYSTACRLLGDVEGVADLGEEGGDTTLEEDHRDDDDHGDEGDDLCVLDESLPFTLFVDKEPIECGGELDHGSTPLLR